LLDSIDFKLCPVFQMDEARHLKFGAEISRGESMHDRLPPNGGVEGHVTPLSFHKVSVNI